MKRLPLGLVALAFITVFDRGRAARAAPSTGGPAPETSAAALPPPTGVTWGTGILGCDGAFSIMNGVAITNRTRQEIRGALFIDKSPVPSTEYRVFANSAETYYPTTPKGLMNCTGPLRDISVRGTGPAFASAVDSTRTYRPLNGVHHYGPAVPEGTKAVFVEFLSASLLCNSKETAKFAVKLRNTSGASTFAAVKLIYQTFTQTLTKQVQSSVYGGEQLIFDTGLAVDCGKGLAPSASFELTTMNPTGTPATVKPPPVHNPTGLVPLVSVRFAVGP